MPLEKHFKPVYLNTIELIKVIKICLLSSKGVFSTYSCGIKISGTIFLSLQQNLCKTHSTVIMTDIKSSL
jgi:hypothetical protein